MKPFQGFPARMEFTPVPNLFLSHLMHQISDINELKTTLHIFMSIYIKKGYPRFTSLGALLNNYSLMKSLEQTSKSAEDTLRNALESAVKRGTILKMTVDYNGKPEELYFLNTPSDRQAIDKIQNGILKLPDLKTSAIPPVQTEDLPNIFTLYEDNIGMLTPMIAEEIKEAEKLYPETWIRDAIKEAIKQGKQKWSYIQAILERWTREGRQDGAYRQDTEKRERDRYTKQKYGHMVQQ